MSLQSLIELFYPTLLFFCGLTAAFHISYRLWGRFKVSQIDRALLASCMTSLSHGLPATVFAALQISSSSRCTSKSIVSLVLGCPYTSIVWNDKVYQAWPLRVGSVNSHGNILLLQYTLAYMFSDSIWYLIPYTPTDFLFCIHHVVVMLYVVTTLLAGRGAISCVFMLLFGECTSLWQNSWYISETLAGRSKALDRYHQVLSVLYPASYILVRSIVGIPSVLWLCWQLHETLVIPDVYKNTWIAICLVSLAGSQIWSFSLFKTWKKGQHEPQKLAEKLQ